MPLVCSYTITLIIGINRVFVLLYTNAGASDNPAYGRQRTNTGREIVLMNYVVIRSF